MIKYDLFASETNNRFGDFEYALSELEKNMQITTDVSPVELTYPLNDELTSEQTYDAEVRVNVEEYIGSSISDIDTNNESASIMSVDLKNIIKQELASSS